MSHFAIRLSIGLLLLSPLSFPAASTAIAASENHIVIGRISNEPRKHFGRLKAMADYLMEHLAGNGVTSIDIIMVSKLEEMEDLLAAGRVDILSETPFMALDMVEKGHAEILMREWKKGVAEYHSIIIARKDGPIQRLEDLVGRRFVFEDPGSTSGYLMPRSALEAAGLSLQKLADARGDATPGKIAYSFANGEINVVAWVHRGIADAGAISNLDWDSKSSTPAHFRKDLKIIHRTDPVTRSVFLVRRQLDDTLKKRIAAVLEQMHESPAGRATMKKYFKVVRYDRFEGEALAGLENARRLRQSVAGRPE